MAHHQMRSICVSLVMLLLLSPTFSQTKTGSQPDFEPLNEAPRISIYQVLDQSRQLAEEARGLQPSEEEAIYIVRMSDRLWQWDQVFARRLLMRAFDLTVESLRDHRGANPSLSNADPRLQFRQIAAIAGRHDAKLEKQLTESWHLSLASEGDEVASSQTDPAQLSYLLLGESAGFLGKDDQKVRVLFRQSVYNRVLPAHCFWLMSQRRRSSDLTDSLFSDALDVLVQRPLHEANELLLLSSYLFSPNHSIGYDIIGGYNAANISGNVSAPPPNSILAKKYLEVVLMQLNPGDAVPSDVVYFELKNLLPQYQLLAPELLNDVYARMGSLAPSVSGNDTTAYARASNARTASESDSNANWEERLRKADKLDNAGRRDLEYFTIIEGYLLPKKDFARALTVAEHLNDDTLREKLRDFINLTSLQANRKSLAGVEAESDCNKIKDPLLRVIAFGTLAQSLIKQKMTAEGIAVLNKAVVEAKAIAIDQDRLQARLMLTQLYLSADAAAGFEAAQATFREINKDTDFNMGRSALALKLTVYGLANELPLLASPSSLISTVQRMARLNCVETFGTCRLLENKKTRLWATLEAVQVGLEEATKTTSKSEGKAQ
jgi:hypothetical protein